MKGFIFLNGTWKKYQYVDPKSLFMKPLSNPIGK